MFGFIYNNSGLFFVGIVIFFLLILYFIFKKLPVKVAKKEIKKDEKEKVEEIKKIETNQEQIEEKEISEQDKKMQNNDKNIKKDDKKPKIVQVFKREHKDESGNIIKTVDPIYDRNVDFVNTSKNIAKFKSFTEPEETNEQEITDDFGFVADEQENCEFCEDKVKHFDHSIRMSKILKDENTDDMFVSHISDKYLNINSDRHLNLDEKFNRKLFSMAEQMMVNSDGKLPTETEGISSQQKLSLFSLDLNETNDVELENFDDEVKVNMKTALIADTYFNRKRKNKR